MKLELNTEQLAETRKWQERNWTQQLERIRSILDGFLTTDLDQALRFIDYDRDGVMGPRGHGDAAASIAQSLVQAVTNCDLRGLAQAGADLQRTIETHDAIIALRETLPPEVRAAWEATDQAVVDAEHARRAEDEARRAAKAAAQCQAIVHESGRGVGFHQCGNKATGVFVYEGVEYRGCGKHKGEKGARPHIKAQRLNTEARS